MKGGEAFKGGNDDVNCTYREMKNRIRSVWRELENRDSKVEKKIETLCTLIQVVLTYIS